MPKYFYVCTDHSAETWTTTEGYLVDALNYVKWIGSRYWPCTRREARIEVGRRGSRILQFDAQTLKFIKEVK